MQPSLLRRILHRLPLPGAFFFVPALVGLFLLGSLLFPWLGALLWQTGTVASGDEPLPWEAARATPASESRAPLPSIGPDSPRVKDAPSQGDFWIDAPDAQVADYLVSVMDPDELLGQLFLLGWPRETAEGPIMDWLKRRNLSGVKIFGWNGQNLATLATALGQMQASALASEHGIPLFTATDQEGGMVRHIKDTSSVTPGNLALGAAGLSSDAYQSALLIGRELRAMGVNMNYAPTVDVYTNPEAHVIASRAFGSQALMAAWLGLAQFQGYRDARVVATAKHFPGHGDASGDSHGMMPVLQDKLDDLWNRDFLPYRLMIPEGLPAILVGHLSFPRISQDELPASLSPKLNRELLRGKLGFEGIVITDDLFMGGASAYAGSHGWGMSDIVIESIRAGNDIVMMSRTPDPDDIIWTKIRARYDEDKEFRALVKDSVRRSLMVKLAYLKPADRVPLQPDPKTVHQSVPAPDAAQVLLNQAGRAVTVLAKAGIPFQPAEGSRIAVMGQSGDFIRSALAHWPKARSLQWGNEPFFSAEAATVADAQALAARSDWIIFLLSNPNSQEVLAALEPYRERLLVVSTLTPVYLESLPWVKTAVAVYGQGSDSYRLGLAALRGEFQPGGALPVRTGR